MKYLKVKLEEKVQDESQIGRKPSLLMPECWNRSKATKFIPGETRFVSWHETDCSGNIIAENISNIDGMALPTALNNNVPIVGTFYTHGTKNHHKIGMVVTLS